VRDSALAEAKAAAAHRMTTAVKNGLCIGMIDPHGARSTQSPPSRAARP
jgi:hypothetical protein